MGPYAQDEDRERRVAVGQLGEERSFDHYARLVRHLLGVPTALVSIVETDRQVFPGAAGLAEPYASARETPLSHSFCQYVVKDEQPLIVADARHVPRLADNLAIPDLNVIAYAGWPLVDGNGRTVGSLCATDTVPREWTPQEIDVLQDLALACSSELQESRRVARDSASLARTIFGSVNVALVFYDADESLVLANELAEQAAEAGGFRLDAPPYGGSHVRRSDNQTPIPVADQVIPRALRGDLAEREMEWFGVPGNQMAMVASSQRVRREDGSLWGTLIAAHPVTDLVRSLQVKEEFITTVSHELRTPLTSLMGYLELLTDELGEPEGTVADALARIEGGAQRLGERIGELIDTADRRRQLSLESTDVSTLAQAIPVVFGEDAERAGIRLLVVADEPQWAVMDARRVQEAIEHLVSNAIKYSRRGGRVTVAVSDHDGLVRVSVTDEGVGMASDEIAQAFDSFYRADGARQGAVQGLGVGLTRVREAVTAHHGCVVIESLPGEGTTVILEIPRR